MEPFLYGLLSRLCLSALYQKLLKIWKPAATLLFLSWLKIISLKTAMDVISIHQKICLHPGFRLFPSWEIFVLTTAVFYNRSISTRPQLIYSDVIHPHPRYNGLYQIMLSMKYLRPTEDSWTAFITDFKQLLNNYSDVCDIRRLNFPSDWESHF